MDPMTVIPPQIIPFRSVKVAVVVDGGCNSNSVFISSPLYTSSSPCFYYFTNLCKFRADLLLILHITFFNRKLDCFSVHNITNQLEEELKYSRSQVIELEEKMRNLEEEKRRIKLHLDEFITENTNFKDHVTLSL